MKVIQELCDYIEEEICDAEKYAIRAIECKESNNPKADTFFRLASDEVGHANSLHSLVVSEIESYRKEHGEPPEAMQMLYSILHKKHIAHMATVKGLLSLYRGDK